MIGHVKLDDNPGPVWELCINNAQAIAALPIEEEQAKAETEAFAKQSQMHATEYIHGHVLGPGGVV